MGIKITGGVKIPQGKFSVEATPAPPPATGSFLWGWGGNGNGQLGLEDTAKRSSPVQIGLLSDWASVDTRHIHTLAVKTDGTLWAWGSGSDGKLGLGDTSVNRSSPVQLGSLTTWASVAVGQDHSLAIKTDGSLWSWGLGGSGRLGLGDNNIDRSSPVQIGSLTNWATISSGKNHSLAVKTDGTLWAWGDNTSGKLGNGTVFNSKSSPVQIGALTTWASVSAGLNHSLALRTSEGFGRLYAWGENILFSGQLGVGDTLTRSVPTQVGSSWASIGAGYKHSRAVKTDGRLFAWGDSNTFGTVGDGVKIDRSSPVQIGSLTNWAYASSGNNQANALKTDGTLWGWGRNNDGELAQGDAGATPRSSPVQIGSDTDWTALSVGNSHSLAIKTIV